MKSQKTRSKGLRAETRVLAALVLVGGLTVTGVAAAQTFDSGSTGADGAFAPTGATVEFNPKALNLDPEGDNVLHFTTITVPSGMTVVFSAKWTNGPVYWLASGAVNIAGTLNLDGGGGTSETASPANRGPAIPGPGGFPGGWGVPYGGSQRAGFGPGGGRSAGNPNQDRGTFAGTNDFLLPLIGGSGGAGRTGSQSGRWGAGGGAGGGALLIASSEKLTVAATGRIYARGGPGGSGWANSGSGGSIRLAAPVVDVGGEVSVAHGADYYGDCYSKGGKVRIEAFQHNWTFSSAACGSNLKGSPFRTFVPTTPPPSIRVVGIANMSVPPDPTGSFELPDVVFDFGNAIDVLVEARYVPPGTDVKLHLYSTDGADQVVTAAPLQGTLEQSTTAVSVVFPPGFSRGFAHAVWE